MAITAGNVVVVVGLAVGLAGTAPVALSAEPELPAIRILVIPVAGVPPSETLARAQAETARIFAAAGVGLVWEVRSAALTAFDAANPSSSLSRLTMIIIADPDAWPERVAEHALGATPAAHPQRVGRLAYAFHGRIEASARRYGTDSAKILGHVIAHEVGHILLARRAHSSTGIMRGRWDRFEIHSIETSSLRFTNEQARSIRRTVVNVNGDHQRLAGIVGH